MKRSYLFRRPRDDEDEEDYYSQEAVKAKPSLARNLGPTFAAGKDFVRASQKSPNEFYGNQTVIEASTSCNEQKEYKEMTHDEKNNSSTSIVKAELKGDKEVAKLKKRLQEGIVEIKPKNDVDMQEKAGENKAVILMEMDRRSGVTKSAIVQNKVNVSKNESDLQIIGVIEKEYSKNSSLDDMLSDEMRNSSEEQLSMYNRTNEVFPQKRQNGEGFFDDALYNRKRARRDENNSDAQRRQTLIRDFLNVEKSVQTVECIDFEKHEEKKSKEVENLLRATTELKQALEIQRSKVRASKETIKRLLVEQSRVERKQAKERVMEATLRIGQFRPARVGEHFKDQWIDGWAIDEINKKLQRINHERSEIVNATKNLKNRKSIKDSKRQQNSSLSLSSSTSDLPSTSNNIYTDDGFLKPELPPKEMTAQEYIEQEEIYKLRKEHLKKEETDLLTEKDRLERERNLHIREMKRVQCEEQSRFRDHILLNDRYLLLSLLGKGGFSEVWRAFDLDENRYVACKIHQVNKDWKEDKKANYVKHAMREKDIHKSLDHPRIVRLFDLFTIDNDSFCTVLEYCDGNDLDFYLKQHKQIPEKEARCIIMQVVSALKYLSEQKYPIIHYDLKPANILLQSGTTSGEIKITDFGLSKTIENVDDDDESIELTSQGAGTYWYLPPETFTPFGDGGPPKISNKVDVWSVGVIFYQCIYGKRPFGHEKTQQQILEERTIFNAQEVTFPLKPPVTQATQDFIRRCLQCRKEERADVSELIRHELFRPRGQKSQQPQSPSAKSARSEQADCD
ncbi:Protein kinase domain-containing protein [Meloidogyne graminicola]|uniref:Protein kinase domain-containing protein n=1 Tax=Meloidogyne graminicola TaxID=189291 RepID=A0A8S9ZTJ6_9BILA|nr:Protein kinase domain-containing protein [Meloidogyne graminicola]